MTNTKKSQGPVRQSGPDIFAESYCIASAHTPVTSSAGNQLENAAFIVKAWNAHDDLVQFAELVAAGHLTKEGFIDAAKRTLERNNLEKTELDDEVYTNEEIASVQKIALDMARKSASLPDFFGVKAMWEEMAEGLEQSLKEKGYNP